MPDPRPDPRADLLRRRRAQANDGAPDLEVAAIKYDAGADNAPKLVAHGKGHTAQKILELAAEHDLAIKQDATLVAVLGALDVGAEIPPDLYGVIAEVLAWAYHADQRAGERRGNRAA
jgi:flagellar biosynthesis protein